MANETESPLVEKRLSGKQVLVLLVVLFVMVAVSLMLAVALASFFI